MSHSLSAHLDSRYIVKFRPFAPRPSALPLFQKDGSGLMYILAYKLIKSMMTSIDFNAFADFFFFLFFFFFYFFPQIVKMWSSHYHAINMTMVPRTVCHIHHRIENKQSDRALSPQFELNMKFINLKKIIKKIKRILALEK